MKIVQIRAIIVAIAIRVILFYSKTKRNGIINFVRFLIIKKRKDLMGSVIFVRVLVIRIIWCNVGVGRECICFVGFWKGIVLIWIIRVLLIEDED